MRQSPAYWVDAISGVSITTTAKIKLGGTQIFATGADYTVPGDARSIVGVRPKLYTTTPTANQAVTATLKVESADLHLGDYEVFAEPIETGLGTTENMYTNESHWYPTNFACAGGEKVQFFGTAQVTNTAATYLECDVLLSDAAGASCGGINPQLDNVLDYSVPVQAKIAGINYGGGPTASSTATDGGLQISAPQKLIKGLYGLLVGTTPAASKPAAGLFTITAGELVLNPQRWIAEPITGFLGTTTAGQIAHLTKVEGLNIRLKAPSFVRGGFTINVATTTACNWEVGYMYQDG